MEQINKQNMDESLKKPDLIAFFDKDASFVFAYKKTEKLASAVYMVTNLFPENEPIRLTLRKKVSELLSFTLLYKDVKASSLTSYVYEAQSKVLEIVSLLEVSMLGGLVSNMNFSLLKSEFLNLTDVFNAGLSAHKESSQELISSNFFHVEESQNQVVSNFHNKNTNSSDMSLNSFKPSYSQLKDGPAIQVRDEFKRSNRQNVILNLIKKKKEVTIKDIAVIIKDCSEKTIQRELISFMNAGVLKRVGERRWSKYSLA